MSTLSASKLTSYSQPHDRLEQCLNQITTKLLRDDNFNNTSSASTQYIFERIKEITFQVFSQDREIYILRLQHQCDILESENQQFREEIRRLQQSQIQRRFSPEISQMQQEMLQNKTFQEKLQLKEKQEKEISFRQKISEQESEHREVIRLKRIIQDSDEKINRLSSQLSDLAASLNDYEQQNNQLQRQIAVLQENKFQSDLELKITGKDASDAKSKNEHAQALQTKFEKSFKDSKQECETLLSQIQELKKKTKQETEQYKKLEEEFSKNLNEIDKIKKKRDGDIIKYKQALDEVKIQSVKKITKFKERSKELQKLNQTQNEELEEMREVIKDQEKQFEEMSSAHQRDGLLQEQRFKREFEQLEYKCDRDKSMVEDSLKQQFHVQYNDKVLKLDEVKRELAQTLEKVSSQDQEIINTRRQIKTHERNSEELGQQNKLKEEKVKNYESQLNYIVQQKEQNAQEFQEDIRNLNQQIRDMKFTMDQSDSLLNQVQQENYQNQQESDSVLQENKRFKDLVTRIQFILKIESRHSVNQLELEKQCRQIVEDREALSNQVAQLDNELQTYQQKLNHYIQRDEDNANSLQKLQEKNSGIERQYNNLVRDHQKIQQEQVVQTQIQLDEALQQLKITINSQKELEYQLKRQITDCGVLRDKNIDLETILKQEKKLYDDLNKKIAGISSENQNIKIQKEELHFKYNGLKQRVRRIFNRQKDLLQNQLKELKQILLNKLRGLEGECKQLVQSQFKKIAILFEQKQRLVDSDKQTIIGQMSSQMEKSMDNLKQQYNLSERQIVNEYESRLKNQMVQIEDVTQRDQEMLIEQFNIEIEDLKRENQSMIQELKRKQDKLDQLDKVMKQTVRSNEKDKQRYLSDIHFLESSKKFDSPAQKLSQITLKSKSFLAEQSEEPMKKISMSSIKGDENNPERTIEELRLEIQQQKSKLSQMKLSFSDKPQSISQNKKVQFQESPEQQSKVLTQDRLTRLSDPPKPRQIFSSTLRKELSSTFNQMI